jgi:hypothetical protein
LTDFGYTDTDLSTPWLQGIYTGTASSGSRSWPWPNDGGATLSNYLTSNVYLPGSAKTATTLNSVLPSPNATIAPRKLLAADPVYQLIMRLYNWNYVIDNYNAAGSAYPGTTPCDWRLRFFGTNNNNTLFQSNGSLYVKGGLDSGNLTVNYNEILRWIAGTRDPFPTQLRAGRTRYYSAIPTQITGSYPSYGSTDQQLWKEVIDYSLGFYAYNGGNTYDDTSGYNSSNAMAGYGSDCTWGTPTTNAPPSSPSNGSINYSDNPARPLLRYWFGPLNLVDYTHNCNYYENENNPGTPTGSQGGPGPWFTKSPGDGYEAPMYCAKQAFNAAITTVQNNHPNNWVTTISYGAPRSSSTGKGSWDSGGFSETNNQVRCPLGASYGYASAALFFPFSTINGYGAGGPTAPSTTPGTINYNAPEVTPFDSDPATGMVPSANFQDIVRGNGDTCFAMGLMLAYNQFITTPTSDTTLRPFVSNVANPPGGGNTKTPIDFLPGMAGGLGRKGAQKVVIFETDGICNMSATPTGSGSTGLSSFSLSTNYSPTTYYPIRYDMNNPNSSEYPSTTGYDTAVPPNSAVTNQINNLIVQMNNDFGSTRNPFKLYTLAFGPVFATSAPDRSGALTVLYNMQYYASLAPGQLTPGNAAGSSGPSGTPPAYPSSGPYPTIQTNQIITGTDQQMITNMTAAYTSILESGVQVALIK